MRRVWNKAAPKGWQQAAAAVLLAAVACVNVYRAATQSITADEAFTYNHFAGGDEPVRVYDANNHVLFTWLARASVAALGLSEFSLRLPAVLSGWLYLAAVFALARRLYGGRWLSLLAVTSLALNPFLLDFLSAARGYGLALAMFAWALYLTARDLEEPAASARRWKLAAICLALAVAANLNFAVPGTALAAAFCLLTIVRRPPVARPVTQLARNFLAPGLLLTAAILAWPLRTAQRSAFYYGVDSLRQTLQGLIYYSFCYSRPQEPTRLQNLFWDVSPWVVIAVFGLTAAGCAVAAVRLLRQDAESQSRRESFLLLVGITALLTLALLVALKHGFGLEYPVDRTSLYWIPLFTLLCLTLLASAPGLAWRLMSLPLAAYLTLATLQYALQFNTRYYAQWRYDAATKEMVRRIAARENERPGARVRIGASWAFEPSLNFYRQRYRLSWMERITRDGPRGDFDYYLLGGEDTALAAELSLTVLHRDALSGAVLAASARVIQSGP